MDYALSLISTAYENSGYYFWKMRGKVMHQALYVAPYLPFYEMPFDANEIFDSVYLGDIVASYNKIELKKRGITHIVTVILGVDQIYEDDFKYFNIHVRDIPEENLLPLFSQTNEFIDNALKDGGKVYLHCVAGRSRSGSIATAYVMYKLRVNVETALEHVRKNRPIVCPNPGFLSQLKEYEASLNLPVSTNIIAEEERLD